MRIGRFGVIFKGRKGHGEKTLAKNRVHTRMKGCGRYALVTALPAASSLLVDGQDARPTRYNPREQKKECRKAVAKTKSRPHQNMM
jgi:hypothetical protein